MTHKEAVFLEWTMIGAGLAAFWAGIIFWAAWRVLAG
jgi:hypothetical protein